MSDLTLSKIRFSNGTWEGIVQGGASSGARPDIAVMYLDQPVTAAVLSEGSSSGEWLLRVPVPAEAVADGVHCFVVYDTASDSKLGDFTLIAGEAAGGDLRAEMELLRAELDMLKRAFRRHCLETM